MNTVFLLLAEYGTPTIPLADVTEKYFGMKLSTAEKKAALGDLPIATFRASESQKAPRMIHVQDLADYIDQQRKIGKEHLEKMKAS